MTFSSSSCACLCSFDLLPRSKLSFSSYRTLSSQLEASLSEVQTESYERRAQNSLGCDWFKWQLLFLLQTRICDFIQAAKSRSYEISSSAIDNNDVVNLNGPFARSPFLRFRLSVPSAL
ncbi:hypothetical protein O6P43_033625 [Quillaja saponaria]|uniref:Uncharacterized protein n=1 Tax=Quillaja saponaria TaxID=32244 RepID=A0AAD7KR99_QUISA|nr:hypothetical protein O6P43_033625 [Quillaja saponaria]